MPSAPLLPGLTIVLPCHDEADNVAAAVAQAEAAAARTSERFEIVVVDDGSGDRTGEIAGRLASTRPSVRLVVHPAHQGYGAALRSGIRDARMPYVLLTDADLQFDLLQLEDFLPLVGTADVLAGYRVIRMDPIVRRIDATLWNLLVRVVFGLRVRDIDCAFKLVPRELVVGLDLGCDGAMISTELLVKCRRAGATVREVPVCHRPRAAGHQSGASSHVILLALRELAALRHGLGHAGTGTTSVPG